MIALLRIGSLFDKMRVKLIKGNLNTIWKTVLFLQMYAVHVYEYTRPYCVIVVKHMKLRRGDIHAQAIISTPKLLIQLPKLLKQCPLQHTFPI